MVKQGGTQGRPASKTISEWASRVMFMNALNERSVVLMAIPLLLIIFFMDISLMIGFVGSMLYVIPVAVCMWAPAKRTIVVVGIVSTILTLVAVPLKAPEEVSVAPFNRLFSIITIWVVVLIGLQLMMASERTERQARLIDLSPDAIIMRKLDGTIIFWSAGAEILYGWTREDAIGQNVNSLIHTSSSVPLDEILGQIRHRGYWMGELVQHTKHGHEVIVQCKWTVERGNGDGNFLILESNADVTESKRAAEALRKANDTLEERVQERTKELAESQKKEQARRQELETLMNVVPASIYISRDPEGNDMVGNKVTEELYGVGPGGNVSLLPLKINDRLAY